MSALATKRWRFIECRVEAEVELLPIGAWTWPSVLLRDD